MVSAVLYIHAQPPAENLGTGHSASNEGGLAAANASNGELVAFAEDLARALLATCRQVVVGEVVAGQALVTDNPSKLEIRERETRQPTHMNLVGSRTRGGVDRTVVRKFDVGGLFISVVLALTTIASVRAICVVDTFYLTVAVRVVGAGGISLNPKKLISGVRKR